MSAAGARSKNSTAEWDWDAKVRRLEGKVALLQTWQGKRELNARYVRGLAKRVGRLRKVVGI